MKKNFQKISKYVFIAGVIALITLVLMSAMIIGGEYMITKHRDEDVNERYFSVPRQSLADWCGENA